MNTQNNTSWEPVLKPGQLTENRLIKAFMDGTFPIQSNLPAERELAESLGVTRPTLREALQRLERDGWVDIQHGKPTRVRDFWTEGNLGVTIALAQFQDPLPQGFVSDLFSVRVLLAPAYTQAAVENSPQEVAQFLSTANSLPDRSEDFASYDWKLHWHLTIHAKNPFFTHFINSVKRLYEIVGVPYFSHPETRALSRQFYQNLRALCDDSNAEAAGNLSRQVMVDSAKLWDAISKRIAA